MSYYIIDIDQVTQFPKVPEGAEHQPVLSSNHEMWALYKCTGLKNEGSTGPNLAVQQVPLSLSRLLYSARAYPPALALAQRQLSATVEMDKVAFCETAAALLEDYLANQRSSGYFLAKAKPTETCTFLEGQYYWVLGESPPRPNSDEKRVMVLCDDGLIYSEPVDLWLPSKVTNESGPL